MAQCQSGLSHSSFTVIFLSACGLPSRFMASLALYLIRLLMKLAVTLSSFVAYQAFCYRYHRSLPIRPFVIVIVSLPIRPFVIVIVSLPIRPFVSVIIARC
eukprot:scaffold17604_cov65-Cyclotella_meneghiniana.AAC.1